MRIRTGAPGVEQHPADNKNRYQTVTPRGDPLGHNKHTRNRSHSTTKKGNRGGLLLVQHHDTPPAPSPGAELAALRAELAALRQSQADQALRLQYLSVRCEAVLAAARHMYDLGRADEREALGITAPPRARGKHRIRQHLRAVPVVAVLTGAAVWLASRAGRRVVIPAAAAAAFIGSTPVAVPALIQRPGQAPAVTATGQPRTGTTPAPTVASVRRRARKPEPPAPATAATGATPAPAPTPKPAPRRTVRARFWHLFHRHHHRAWHDWARQARNHN